MTGLNRWVAKIWHRRVQPMNSCADGGCKYWRYSMKVEFESSRKDEGWGLTIAQFGCSCHWLVLLLWDELLHNNLEGCHGPSLAPRIQSSTASFIRLVHTAITTCSCFLHISEGFLEHHIPTASNYMTDPEKVGRGKVARSSRKPGLRK